MADEMNVDAGATSENTTETTNASTGILTGNDPVGQETTSEGDDAGQTDAQQAENSGNGQTDENWALTAPDGMDEAHVKEISDGCKKLGMTKDVAQRVLEMRAKEQAEWDKTQVQWQHEIAADAEFGGTNFGETVALARKALGAFDPDGTVRAMLDKTGYSNNPEVIKLFARAGKAMGEDSMINGRGGAAQKSLADRLYHD